MNRSGHRPQRESPQKDASHYKQEARTLKKQVARLQKELGRLTEANNQLDAELDPDPESDPRDKCPKCLSFSSIGSYTTPSGKKVSRCKVCKA